MAISEIIENTTNVTTISGITDLVDNLPSRPVPLIVHNVLDYVHGATVAASPFLFGFSDVPIARNVCIGAGLNTITYSLFTNYTLSVSKTIPLGVHMGLDVFSGLSIMAAPFVLGYHRRLTAAQLGVHFLFGVGALVLVAMTRSLTESEKIRNHEGVSDDVSDNLRAA